MTRRLLIAALTASLGIAILIPASAAAEVRCLPIESTQQARDLSVFVFKGTVVSAPMPGGKAAQVLGTGPVRFAVTEYLKGEGPNEVSVTQPLPGTEPLPPPQEGETWIVYANGTATNMIFSPCVPYSQRIARGDSFITAEPDITGGPSPYGLILGLLALFGLG